VSRRSPRRNAAAVTAMTLVTFALGATLAVLVTGSASAAGSKGTTTKKATTTKKTTTTTTKKQTPTPTPLTTTGPDTPAAHFFVINGTVNAASDHEIVGSSAFPNFTTGAVDNYYSMAHSHVDNSPFAEGRASPADTGPLGQTAAAGNTQQPQYADARWPGDPPKATYGSQGGPYATAAADEYRATADASEASNGLSGPGPTGAPTLAVPKGFDARLQDALAGWKSKWQSLAPKQPPAPAVTTPVATLPNVPKPTAPKAKVPAPTATVTTPVATVTTPNDTAGGGSPAPPVTVPSPTLPSVGAAGAPRTLASASTPPKDGETLLTSSTMATLDSKTNTLVTSGESSLGRVSLGGGAIVIEGIHVTASIANDGTPSYKAAVSVASATIGGVPVTIDQDGVHVAGQGAGLPYQQASDALNGALKQAGIQLFLVGPEVTKPCGQTSTGSGGGTTTTSSTTTTTTSSTTTSTTPTPSDQSGPTGSCDQTGSASCGSAGGGTGPSLPSVGSTTTTSSNDQTGTTTTPSSCDQTGSTSCGQTGTTTNGTTTTGGVTGIGPGTTTTRTTTTSTTTTRTSTGQTGTTTTTATTPSGCDQSGTLPSTGSCSTAGTTTGTTATSTSTDQTSTTAPPSPFDPTGLGSSASEETVTATGVHLVFTQPVNQSGVPAQFVEHILGEVFVDSLAVPAGNPPDLSLSSSLSSTSPSSSSSFSASSCGGGHSSKTTAGGASTSGGSGSTIGGSSSAGGSTASGSLPSGSALGATSQPGSGSTGNSLPAAFAAALRKPLWLLLAYVLWQALVIGTGASLWNWRRGEAP
jgi:hypothetical protein